MVARAGREIGVCRPKWCKTTSVYKTGLTILAESASVTVWRSHEMMPESQCSENYKTPGEICIGVKFLCLEDLSERKCRPRGEARSLVWVSRAADSVFGVFGRAALCRGTASGSDRLPAYPQPQQNPGGLGGRK